MLVNITLLTLAVLAIALIDAPRLVRRKLWRELVVFALILTAGYILALLRISEIAYY